MTLALLGLFICSDFSLVLPHGSIINRSCPSRRLFPPSQLDSLIKSVSEDASTQTDPAVLADYASVINQLQECRWAGQGSGFQVVKDGPFRRWQPMWGGGAEGVAASALPTGAAAAATLGSMPAR